MGKEKTITDKIFVTTRNAGAFGLVIGGLGVWLAFAAAPVVVWPVLLTLGWHAAGFGALAYGSASAAGQAFFTGNDNIKTALTGCLGLLTTLLSSIKTANILIPNHDERLKPEIEKSLYYIANSRFGTDWKLAKNGDVVTADVPYRRTIVPVTATISDKNLNLDTSTRNLQYETCLNFNVSARPEKNEAAHKSETHKDIHEKIEICTIRSPTQPEIARIMAGP